MGLSIQDINVGGYIEQRLHDAAQKEGRHNKNILQDVVSNLLNSPPQEGAAELAKMVSFLAPELRAEAGKSAVQASKVKELVRHVWPNELNQVDHATGANKEENIRILRGLHKKRAFYLLDEMRIKLGNEQFVQLLKDAAAVDLDFLYILARSQEDELLASYLSCWKAKQSDLLSQLNDYFFLHIFAETGCATAIHTFQNTARALRPDINGRTPLHRAARSGSAEAVQAVWELCTTDALKEQALKPDSDGRTPLHWAAGSGSAEAVRAVWELCTTDALKEQALKPDSDGRTPLHWAAGSGSAEAVQAVWELCTTDALKEQALKPDSVGMTPLHRAARSGSAEAVQAVWELCTTDALKEQALKPDSDGRTPLHWAAGSGSAEAVRAVWELCTTDALKEQALKPDNNGRTPLHFAAESGNAELLQLLGGFYTAAAYLSLDREGKSVLETLSQDSLEIVLPIYADISEEYALLKSELLLRQGKKEELAQQWEQWLSSDRQEIKINLLPLVLAQHESMADVLTEFLEETIAEEAKKLAGQDLLPERKLALLLSFLPLPSRSAVDRLTAEQLSQAKNRQVDIEGFKGTAQAALHRMRLDWADKIQGVNEGVARMHFASLQKGLAALPALSLAALARDPKAREDLLRCLNAFSDRRLSLVVAQIDGLTFLQAFTEQPMLRFSLLKKATEAQKEHFLKEGDPWRKEELQTWQRDCANAAAGAPSLAELTSRVFALKSQADALKQFFLEMEAAFGEERFSGPRMLWEACRGELNDGVASIEKTLHDAAGKSEQIPEKYVCPISGNVMSDPVKLPDGNVCDRSSIERWLKEKATNPFTNNPLTADQLIPQPDLKDEIDKWQKARSSS